MSDEIRKPSHEVNENTGYETQDLSAKGVIYFMVGLALVVVVIYFIVFGMYHFLDTYEKAHQMPMSPMATPQADTRIITHDGHPGFPGTASRRKRAYATSPVHRGSGQQALYLQLGGQR